MNFSLNKILSASLLIALIGLSVILAISIQQTLQIKNTSQLVTRTELLISRVQKLVLAVLDNELGAKGYVITGEEHFLEPLKQSEIDIEEQFDLLAASIPDFPMLGLSFDSLKVYSAKRVAFSKQLVKTRREQGVREASLLVLTGVGKNYTNTIRGVSSRIESEANALLQNRKSNNDNNIFLLNLILYVVLIAAFMLCVLIIKRIRSDTSKHKINEEKFIALLDAAPDATVIVNEGGNIHLINRQVENLFGYTREELIGKPVEIMIPQPLHREHMKHRTGFMREAGVRPMGAGIELHAVKKSGALFPVEISLSPIRTNDGLLVSASIRDITLRKKEKEQLESLIREINQSSNAIYTVDSHRHIKTWNIGAEKLYGFTFEEVMGKDSNEILNTALSPDEISSILKDIAEKDYWSGEVKRSAKNGTIIFVRSSTTTIRDKAGNITGYVSMSFDITSQKKLREQVNHLASIVEQASEAIISLNTEQIVISWNGGAEKLYGFTPEEALGKKMTELNISNLQTEDILIINQQVIKGGFWKTEMNFNNKDGFTFFGALTANILKDEHGAITSTLLIVNDISGRKQLEEQLRRSNSELEAFSYSVSHDLRAPLRAIIGYTTALEDDYVDTLDAEAKRIALVIKRNAIRMGELIDDLLNFSRTARLEMNLSGVDTQKMVKDIIMEMLQENKNSENISWNIKQLPEVRVDKSTFRQVWINLISNAVKYSGKVEKPYIEIGSTAGSNEITFYIKDNGVGFNNKYKHKLFKVFQRLHKSSEFEGTGVGLALVEKIVYKHGGRIWAEAVENEGACFYFSLPA